mgnify:CR=1 FL=1
MTDCEDCHEEIDMTDVAGQYSGRCANCTTQSRGESGHEDISIHDKPLWAGGDDVYARNNEGAS